MKLDGYNIIHEMETLEEATFYYSPGVKQILKDVPIVNKKEFVAKFSFLMVLVPIIAANVKDLLDFDISSQNAISITPLIIGFIAAFLTGLIACTWMLKIVKRGKLIYFAAYCLIVGLIAIIFSIW